LWRTITVGGSTFSRSTVAMSARRMVLAVPAAALPARMGSWRSSSSEWNCPCTRTSSRSDGVLSAPPDSTAFCAAICATTWFMSRPSCASRCCEISTNTRSACTP